MKIVRVSAADGQLLDRQLLIQAETVHRHLRPQIPQPYADQLLRIFAGGAEMAVALDDAGVIAGVVVFRVTENTMAGRRIYIDDLVADPETRSKGVGKGLMDYVKQQGLERGCTSLELESGTQREQAHRFYFREGFTIKAFSFKQPLG